MEASSDELSIERSLCDTLQRRGDVLRNGRTIRRRKLAMDVLENLEFYFCAITVVSADLSSAIRVRRRDVMCSLSWRQNKNKNKNSFEFASFAGEVADSDEVSKKQSSL